MNNSTETSFLPRFSYDPFGMITLGRNWDVGSGYRYGFNGKEQDDEISSNGNQYDYGFRIYNPRLGKFLSKDPLTSNYSMLTPYQFASNTPIQAIDLDGLEAWKVNNEWTSEDISKFSAYVQTELEKITAVGVEGSVYDCADLAIHFLIGYASLNGLPLEFTGTNGKIYNAQDLSNPEGDVDAFEKKVADWTNALSLRTNEMIKINETPVAGDMTNSGGHINVVRMDDPNNPVPMGEIPSVSGTIPAIFITKDRYTWVGPENDFYRWEVLENAPEPSPMPEKIETIKISPIQTSNKEPELKQPIKLKDE